MGPLSLPAYNSIKKCLKTFLYRGKLDYFKELVKVREELRKNLAKLIGCKKEEVAIIKNTSHGILISLLSLPDKKNSNIIVQKDAFPAIKIPAIHSGYRVIFADLSKEPLKEIKKKINKKTLAVLIDWVHFFKGYVNDIKTIGEFLKEKEIFFIVDGIQGAGVIPLNLNNLKIDFFIAHSAKWLLGPPGIGFMYINTETFKKIKKKYIGWLSINWKDFSNFENLSNLPLRKGAQIFEEGSYNSPGIFGFNENLKIIINFGKKEINKKIKELKNRLKEEFKKLNFEFLPKKEEKYVSGIISFKSKKNHELFEFLKYQNISISYRNGFIRVSPHFFNDKKEINYLLKKITDFYGI